jgi:hypothetical protein
MRTAIWLGVLAITGCYVVPTDEDRFEDKVIATRYDPEAEFAKYPTFAISPVVDYLDASEDDPETRPLDDALAKPLIDVVRSELVKYGYREVEPAAGPQMGVKLSVSKGTVVGVDYTPYWGWYGYPYYWWGYYYPYGTAVVYSYNRSILKTDLVDIRDIPGPGELPSGGDSDAGVGDGGMPFQLRALWTGVVYGAFDEGEGGGLAAAEKGVRQAFAQSPYLRRTP